MAYVIRLALATMQAMNTSDLPEIAANMSPIAKNSFPVPTVMAGISYF
jgi:hypothetical protein